MKKYNAKYTGTIVAEWDYKGRHFEARQHEDYFGYISEYSNGYLCIVGNAGYDYFLGDNWLPLAQRLGIHKSNKRGIKVYVFNGRGVLCDDCEPGSKIPAQWVAEGGPVGYLYLCNDHKDEYVEDLFGV
jgi:hypothetical protein